jgi:hypothetical protein
LAEALAVGRLLARDLDNPNKKKRSMPRSGKRLSSIYHFTISYRTARVPGPSFAASGVMKSIRRVSMPWAVGWLLVALIGVVVGGVGSMSGRAAVIPPAVKLGSAHGRVQFVLRDAEGKPMGLVLQNRAVVVFSPEVLHDASPPSIGEEIQIRGYSNLGNPNQVFQQAIVTEHGRLIFDESAAPNPPISSGFEAPARFTELKKEMVHAPVFALIAQGNGDIDQLVLNDGTLVQVSSGGLLDKKNFKLGDEMTVTGIGRGISRDVSRDVSNDVKAGKGGRYIQAMSIKDSKQFQQILAQGDHLESWTTVTGKIAQTLLTPRGLVNGVVLANHSAIRFRPVPAEDVSRLQSGVQVEAAGPGKENQVYTSGLLLNQKGLGLSTVLTSNLPRPEPSRAMDRMIDRGQILTVLKDAYGDPEALVLTDGTSVQIPPDVRRGLDFYPKPGETVTLEGYGGKYADGNAIRASALRRDFSADQPA